MQTIWDYLQNKGHNVTPRTEKNTVHLVLDSCKLNPTQKSRMTERAIAMPKLDGVYSLVTYIGGEVRHWGRSGKALMNCEELDAELEGQPSIIMEGDVVFISEITSDDPLAKLSGYLTPARVNDTTFTPTNLCDNFHDVLQLDDFIAGKSLIPLSSRRAFLKNSLAFTNLKIIHHTMLTIEEAKLFAEFKWKKGEEGVVYHQDSPWVAGRRNETKIKFKEKLSYDVKVVGVVSGKRGSKYETCLGKLIVAFRRFGEPKGEFIEVSISGMTDSQRDLWWEDPTLILGKVVKMDAKSFTEEGSLREPRFKEVRTDKLSDFPIQVYKEGLEQKWKAQALHMVQRWGG